MPLSISKTASGTILFDQGSYGVTQYSNLTNINIRYAGNFIYVSHSEGEIDIDYSDLVNIGGAAKPGTIKNAALLLGSDFFIKANTSNPGAGVGDDASALTKGTLPDARLSENVALVDFVRNIIISNADFVIEKAGLNTIAKTNRKDLINISGTSSATVINNALIALNYDGYIHIKGGDYNLDAEVVIKGISLENPSRESIIISGDGYKTKINQFTPGGNLNAIVIKNKANFSIKNLYVAVNDDNLSGILLDDNGATSEISCWGGILDNVFISSTSALAPAFHAKNFWDLSVPFMRVLNPNGDAIHLENTSITTNYGNSHFGAIRTRCGTNVGNSGLKITSSNSNGNKYINLLSWDHYECLQGRRGIYASAFYNSNFAFVDIEDTAECIVFDGGNNIGNTRMISISSGYLLPNSDGTGIKTTQQTGGISIDVIIDGDGTVVPVDDASQYRIPNSYDLRFGASIDSSKISIIEKDITVLNYRSTNGASTNQILSKNATIPTPTSADVSKKIANTEFVSAAISNAISASTIPKYRVASYEAQGNNTTINLLGLSSNGQGTATSRNATNSFYGRLRKIGKVSAVGLNSRAGEIGNQQYFMESNLIFQARFAIQNYNVGHSYMVGLAPLSGDGSTLPSTYNNSILMFADPGDLTWKLKSNSGLAIALGISFPVNTSATDVYEVNFYVNFAGGNCTYIIKRLNTGDIASGLLTSIPSGSLSHYVHAGNLATGVAASIDVANIRIITDF